MQAKNEDFNENFFIGFYEFLIQKNPYHESNLEENLVFIFQYADKSH